MKKDHLPFTEWRLSVRKVFLMTCLQVAQFCRAPWVQKSRPRRASIEPSNIIQLLGWRISKHTIAGWWFQPTPLKNDGVRHLGWDDIPNMEIHLKKNTKAMLTTNQINHGT